MRYASLNLSLCLKYSSDENLRQHAELQLKRRQPGIMKLVKKFNDCVTKMETLKAKGEAPTTARIPKTIESKGLFSLDIEDDIWQDVDVLNEEPAPRWMSDETVRRGIRALLVKRRCIEEVARLQKEMLAMQEWFKREWAKVETACRRFRKYLLDIFGHHSFTIDLSCIVSDAL